MILSTYLLGILLTIPVGVVFFFFYSLKIKSVYQWVPDNSAYLIRPFKEGKKNREMIISIWQEAEQINLSPPKILKLDPFWAGEMAKPLRALDTLPDDRLWFPARIWRTLTVSRSSPRDLFRILRASVMHVVQSRTCRQNTHTYNIF